MGRNTTRDMTAGSPTKQIVGFFLPLLFGTLFQQFYNIVDTVIVGRFLGVDALAGVGSTGALNFLVLGFSIGVCNGFAIPVAQKFGEKDYAGLKRFAVNAIMLAVLMSFGMMVVVCAACKTVLRLMNTPENIFIHAYSYIVMIFMGIPVVFIYNVLFGIIRSLGDSRTPVVYLVISSIVNVALDLLFIVVVHMGVKGAALATILSQLFSSLLCIRYLRHSELLIFHKQDWKLDRACTRKLFGMGVPTGLQYSITALGSIILQSAVNSLGSMAVAGITAGGKVGQLFSCPFEALGSTMATYGGQNIGAGKLDRISKGTRSFALLGTVYSVLAFGIIWFFGDIICLLFVDASEAEVIANAKQYLILNALGYVLLNFVNGLRFLIQGLGFTRQAVFAGVCEMAARTLVGFWLVPLVGFAGACLSNPAAWLAADLFLVPTYFWAMKKLKSTALLKHPTVC